MRRTTPLNGTLLDTLLDHTRWYPKHFGAVRPEWFVFPGGSRFPTDPVQPITTLKTAWINVRKKAGVSGRWHDNRHTLITELAENGAGDETIMEIPGHVSRQMLSRYAHVRTAAKRKALEEVEKKRAAARERNQQISRNAAKAGEAATSARLQERRKNRVGESLLPRSLHLQKVAEYSGRSPAVETRFRSTSTAFDRVGSDARRSLLHNCPAIVAERRPRCVRPPSCDPPISSPALNR